MASVLAVLHVPAWRCTRSWIAPAKTGGHCREQAGPRRCCGGKLRTLVRIWTASRSGQPCSPSMRGQRQLAVARSKPSPSLAGGIARSSPPAKPYWELPVDWHITARFSARLACACRVCRRPSCAGYAAPPQPLGECAALLRGFTVEPVIVGIVRSVIRAARLIQGFPSVNDANGRALLHNAAAVDAR